jgi:hypothetical protein
VLTDRGVAGGDRVADLGLNSPAFLITMFAAFRHGAIFVPVNFRLAGPELQAVLQGSGATVIVCEDGHRDTLEAVWEFFVIAAVAPMAAIVGASPIVFSAKGVAAPTTYLLAALLFVVFAVGYVAMSHHITNAGGFVAYIAQGFGARLATAAAGLVILAYTALQAALWSQFSVFAHDLADRFGLDVPGGVWMFAALALVTGLTRAWARNLKSLGVTPAA